MRVLVHLGDGGVMSVGVFVDRAAVVVRVAVLDVVVVVGRVLATIKGSRGSG